MPLNRIDTDTFYSLAFQKNESGEMGDTWAMLFDILPAVTYNGMRSTYLTNVQAYNDGLLWGTDPSGGTFKFSGISQFPIPPVK